MLAHGSRHPSRCQQGLKYFLEKLENLGSVISGHVGDFSRGNINRSERTGQKNPRTASGEQEKGNRSTLNAESSLLAGATGDCRVQLAEDVVAVPDASDS